jgi:hypothetical protein
MSDIKGKLVQDFANIFSKKPEADSTPEHLRQIDEFDVERVVRIIKSEFAGAMPYSVGLELKAWEESRTRWDAQRLANALEWAGSPGLAQEVRDLL